MLKLKATVFFGVKSKNVVLTNKTCNGTRFICFSKPFITSHQPESLVLYLYHLASRYWWKESHFNYRSQESCQRPGKFKSKDDCMPFSRRSALPCLHSFANFWFSHQLVMGSQKSLGRRLVLLLLNDAKKTTFTLALSLLNVATFYHPSFKPMTHWLNFTMPLFQPLYTYHKSCLAAAILATR